MAWIEGRSGSYRTVWEPPTVSGLGRQSLTWPDEDYAEFAKKKINEHKNNISKEDAYRLITGREYPQAQPDTQPDTSDPVFAEWADGWLKRRQIATGTRNTYQRQLDQVILPRLGHLPVNRIDHTNVADVLTYLAVERGFKSKTVTRYYSLMHAIFNSAVRSNQTSVTYNPCLGTEFKRDQVDNDDLGDDSNAESFFEVWEYQRILTCAHPDSRPLIQFLAETGARWGEATALQVRDINRAKQVVQIRRAWKSLQKGGHAELGPTKNRSRRTVKISDDLFDQLAQLCGSRADEAFVFRSPRGSVWSQSNFAKRRWSQAIEAASRCTRHRTASCDCPGVLRRTDRPHNVHLLRHSYATWMLMAGIPVADVAADLGHKSVAMVERVYGHVIRQYSTRQVDVLDEIMGRNGSDEPKTRRHLSIVI